jgi:hypothetical protein
MRGARCAAIAVIVLGFPAVVGADIGLPMVAVWLPPAWVALLPIILIEAAVGVRAFAIPTRRALIGQAVANCVSTLLGLPITWAVLAFTESRCCGTALGLNSLPRKAYAVTVQAPWLIPYESELRWMVPVAVLVLAVPFYLMSVGSEYLVLRWMLRDIPQRSLHRWVVWANAASYAFLLAFMGAAFVWSAPFKKMFGLFAPIVERLMKIVF